MRYTVVLLIYFLNSCLVYGDIATDNYDDWNQGVNSYFNPGNRRVLYASARSFQDLGNGYGKDSFRVFYHGKKVSKASASSFQDLGNGYGKDSFRVFYHGNKVSKASARSFQDLGNGYGKDSFRVFYRGKLSSTSGPRLRRLRRKPRKLENVAQERLLLQTWIRSLREMH
jgi:hypothetical protein